MGKTVRSYKVLGELDKAQAAISDAQNALANDPDKAKTARRGTRSLRRISLLPSLFFLVNQLIRWQHNHNMRATRLTMVARLAERVKKSGSDAEGWVMLTRSYLTLGEKEKAVAAVKDARAALASDPQGSNKFNDDYCSSRSTKAKTGRRPEPLLPPSRAHSAAQRPERDDGGRVRAPGTTTNMMNTTTMISHELMPWSAAAEGALDGRVTSLPPPGNRLRARREKETNRARCLPGASRGAGHDQQEAAPKNIFTRVADRGPCDGSN